MLKRKSAVLGLSRRSFKIFLAPLLDGRNYSNKRIQFFFPALSELGLPTWEAPHGQLPFSSRTDLIFLRKKKLPIILAG